MCLDMTDSFAVVLVHTYREYLHFSLASHVPRELPQVHGIPSSSLSQFYVGIVSGAAAMVWSMGQRDDQSSLSKATGVCSPQTVLNCFQRPAGEALLGAKGLWCSACFPLLGVREGGREEIISINLCYPIMGIFGKKKKIHHKEKAWEINDKRKSVCPSLLSLFQWMSGCALSSQLLTPLMSALGSWARPLLRALGKSHLWVKQTTLV